MTDQQLQTRQTSIFPFSYVFLQPTKMLVLCGIASQHYFQMSKYSPPSLPPLLSSLHNQTRHSILHCDPKVVANNCTIFKDFLSFSCCTFKNRRESSMNNLASSYSLSRRLKLYIYFILTTNSNIAINGCMHQIRIGLASILGRWTS